MQWAAERPNWAFTSSFPKLATILVSAEKKYMRDGKKQRSSRFNYETGEGEGGGREMPAQCCTQMTALKEGEGGGVDPLWWGKRGREAARAEASSAS